MGTSYHSIAMFWIGFKKSRDVREFLVVNTQDTGFDEVDELNEKIQEFFSELHITPLDMFITQEAILGYNMTLGDTVDKYQAMWNKNSPNSTVKPEPILAVRTR